MMVVSARQHAFKHLPTAAFDKFKNRGNVESFASRTLARKLEISARSSASPTPEKLASFRKKRRGRFLSASALAASEGGHLGRLRSRR
jgi:hypothetical protein